MVVDECSQKVAASVTSGRPSVMHLRTQRRRVKVLYHIQAQLS
jgi:hypothetical protein